MGEEIDKQPSWQERQELATKKIREAMGGQTPETYLDAANNCEDEVNEYHELLSWYTEEIDAIIVAGDFATDSVATSTARSAVRTAHPEKFARLRELERLQQLNNVRHQHLGSGAHVSMIEASLRGNLLYA